MNITKQKLIVYYIHFVKKLISSTQAPLQSETKEVYSKIIDFWCNEYTEECGPKLRDEIAAVSMLLVRF